jgi:hypothetical protein
MESQNVYCSIENKENNSEGIFLQPIDQQYFKNVKNTFDEMNNFFQDFEHNPMGLLDLSTDSETDFSRKSSFSEESFQLNERISSFMINDAISKIKDYKQAQLTHLKGLVTRMKTNIATQMSQQQQPLKTKKKNKPNWKGSNIKFDESQPINKKNIFDVSLAACYTKKKSKTSKVNQ